MASVNKAIIVGHLGKDPEVRYSSDGGAVANVSVATSESWKDKAGERQERTEWHRVVFFGKVAEVAGEYLKKGALVYVEGRLQTRKWQDRDGNDKYTTEIVGDRMQMLGGAREGGNPGQERAREADRSGEGGANGAKRGPVGPAGTKFDDFEDDIPF